MKLNVTIILVFSVQIVLASANDDDHSTKIINVLTPSRFRLGVPHPDVVNPKINLQVYSSQSSISLLIQYNTRDIMKIRRNFKNYEIESFYLGSLNCSNGETDRNLLVERYVRDPNDSDFILVYPVDHKIITSTNFDGNIEILDLFPNSCYRIDVNSSSFTKPYSSPKLENLLHITYCTKQSSTIILSEYPELKQNFFRNQIVLSSINCRNHGTTPIMLGVVTKCLDSWCNQNTFDTWNFPEEWEFRKNLLVYTTYNISVYTMKDVLAQEQLEVLQNETLIYQTLFITPPFYPSPVSKIEVTSKNASSVSLRWMPPSPPNGELEEYQIIYGEYNWKTKPIDMFSIRPTPCKLWPSFHCTTISDTEKIRFGMDYTFQIFGKNRDVKSYCDRSASLTVTINETEPECPYDIGIRWTNADTNIVKIYWKHPNNTNGVLSHFSIVIKSCSKNQNIYRNDYNQYHVYMINSQDNYKYLYEVDIIPKIDKCVKYALTLNSHNKNGLTSHSSAGIEFYSPPPLIPVFSTNLRVHSENNLISIHFSPLDLSENCDLIESQTILFCIETDLLKNDQILLDKINEKLNASNAIAGCLVVYARTVKGAFTFTIGSSTNLFSDYLNLTLPQLTNLPAKGSYSLKAILVQEYKEPFGIRYKSEIIMVEILSSSSFNALYLLLLLLLIIPVCVIVFRKKFSKKGKTTQNPPEITNTAPAQRRSNSQFFVDVSPIRESHVYEPILYSDEAPPNLYEAPREAPTNHYVEL